MACRWGNFMANRWGNNGNSERPYFFWVPKNKETLFWGRGSKITADGDYSHEIKRWLLLGRKIMTNLDSILKGRAITLLTNVHIVKAMVFLVVIYGCESWTIKKAECWRIDAFFSIFIYLLIYLLYNVVLVLAHINMNPPRVYTCSQSRTPFRHGSNLDVHQQMNG